jgi:hypothetical protein
MSFDTIYNNIDALFDEYIKKHGLRKSAFSTGMKDGDYVLNCKGGDLPYSKSWIKHDLALFLEQVFTIRSDVAYNIKETFIALDVAFKSYVDKFDIDMSRFHTISIQHGTNSKNERYIVLLCEQHSMMIYICDSKGVMIKDLNDIIEVTYVPIVADNINDALHSSVESFKNKMLLLSGKSQATFNSEFVNELVNDNLDNVINFRLQKQHKITDFTYKDKLSIVEILEQHKKHHPALTFSTRSSIVSLYKKDIRFFMDIMKTMLSDTLYEHFSKAVNFYHNYKMIMKQEYELQFNFLVRHKLQDLDGNLFSISFGSDFELTFGILFQSENQNYYRTSLFEIFKRDRATGKKIDVLRTNDFSDFYSYLFEQYSVNLTSLLNKSVTEMTWDDVTVLQMYHFK